MSLSVDPRIGTELLGYRIEALLGRGGMSVVYRAHHAALDRKVALKLLAPELAEDERFRERFLRESKLAASLDHPHIVPIYDAGEAEGQLYIAMRYVEGTDLKSLLRKEGALEPKRALALVAQLADALDAAHARGLVHRDVKPSNALLDSSENLYLADFGLTKSASDRSALTLTGRIIGTVDYAAPEQIEGKAVDRRGDVYSLGCLLYECLRGEVPFPRDSELAVLWAHVQEPPPTLAAYPALDPVIAKALAKDPEDRYATCAELIEAAREALGLREIVLVRDRRPLLLVGLGALVIAGALAAGLVLGLGGGSPKPDLTVRNNTLVRIDPKTNKIAAVIRVGRGPRAVAVAGGTVWVYNTDDRTVSAIDARTNAVERTVSISGGFPAESGPLIAADESGAWVVSSAGGKGVLTHVRPGVAYQPEFSLDYDPGSVALGEGAVWVAANSVRGNAVLRISPRTGAVLGKVPFRAGVYAGLFWIAVGEGAVWVTNGGTLFRIDPVTTRITGRVRFRGGGTDLVVAAGDGAVSVSDWQARRLLRIDPRTLRTTKTISQPGFDSSDVALGEGSLWWNGYTTGTVWRVDPRTGKVVSTIRVTPPRRGISPTTDFHPSAIAISARSLWVTVSAG